MIQCKFQNIEKLEADKAHKAFKTAIMSSLNKFLLNILFNQIKILINLDLFFWSKNLSVKDSSQWCMHICQDFLWVLIYSSNQSISFILLDSIVNHWFSCVLVFSVLHIILLISWDSCSVLSSTLILLLMLIWVRICETLSVFLTFLLVTSTWNWFL